MRYPGLFSGQFSLFHFCFALAGFAFALLPDLAYAGTGGTELDAINNKLSDLIQGGGATLIIGISIVFGLAAIAFRFSTAAVLSVVGVGIAAGYGYPLVTGFVTAIV